MDPPSESTIEGRVYVETEPGATTWVDKDVENVGGVLFVTLFVEAATVRVKVRDLVFPLPEVPVSSMLYVPAIALEVE